MPLLTIIAVTALIIYAGGYFFYGRFLSRSFGLSNTRKTPAEKINDGKDFVPTPASMLLGQHFSAIAAVGPIAGPILAGLQYGWMAGLLWIIFGAVFIGGVHDFSALIASVRHGGRSIGDLLKDYLGGPASKIFSLYIWFSLIYVIVVFTDLTASAFINRPSLGEENFGPGVATSSFLYLGLAFLMGLAITKLKMRLRMATLIFVPMIFVVIWAGQLIPITFAGDALSQQKKWDLLILLYCFIAAVIPIGALLQPRGYLGGFILYTTFAVGLFGIFFGGNTVAFPILQPLQAGASPIPLFPLLFTTVACGACSGFHGLVGSGTTSKQVAKETDTIKVGYGGMLLESLIAVVTMATLMLLPLGSPILELGPDEIYARGLAHFMQVFGLPFAAGVTFGKLAFATFIYDTLDVSARLGRYVLQEMFGWKSRKSAAAATLITVFLPALTVFIPCRNAQGAPIPLWKMVWPVFGASNQLLAALTLLGVTLWMKAENRNWLITAIPAVFMCVVSLSSLVQLIKVRFIAAGPTDPVALTALILAFLATGYIANAALRWQKTTPRA